MAPCWGKITAGRESKKIVRHIEKMNDQNLTPGQAPPQISLRPMWNNALRARTSPSLRNRLALAGAVSVWSWQQSSPEERSENG
jgi:hypothetical protein